MCKYLGFFMAELSSTHIFTLLPPNFTVPLAMVLADDAPLFLPLLPSAWRSARLKSRAALLLGALPLCMTIFGAAKVFNGIYGSRRARIGQSRGCQPWPCDRTRSSLPLVDSCLGNEFLFIIFGALITHSLVASWLFLVISPMISGAWHERFLLFLTDPRSTRPML